MASLDEIVTRLGFGSYQLRNYILISALMLFHPFQILLVPFIAQKMEYKSPQCHTLFLRDRSSSTLFADTDRSVRDRLDRYQIFCKYIENRTLDDSDNSEHSGGYCHLNTGLERGNAPESLDPQESNTEVVWVEDFLKICSSGNYTLGSGIRGRRSKNSLGLGGLNLTCCLGGTSPDKQRDSIISEWNLRGSREYLIPLASSIFMIGSIVGSFVFAAASDSYGRKKALAVSMVTFVAATIAPGLWSPWYELFAIYRFVQGMCHSGNFMIHMVMLTELLPRDKRYILTISSTLFYSTGYVALAGLAYVLVKWRTLQTVTGAMMGGYIIAVYFMDESLYWLVDKGHFDRAARLVIKSARQNGLCDPFFTYKTVLGSLEEGNGRNVEMEIPLLEAKSSVDTSPPGIHYFKNWQLLDLFTIPILRKRTLLAATCTFLLFQLHMTLTFGIHILRGSMYLNFALLGLTEIPGNLMGLCALKLGRRKPIMLFNTLCAITLLLGIALNYYGDILGSARNVLDITLYLCSRCFASGTLVVCFLYVSEIYPTPIRNTGYGFNNAINRTGFMLAPFIAYLPHYHPIAMPVLLSSFCLISSIAVAFLPPTKDKPLPQTMKDIESIS